MTALPASSADNPRLGPIAGLIQRLPPNYSVFGLAAIPLDVWSVMMALLLTAGAYDYVVFGRIEGLREPFQIGAVLAAFTAVLMYLKGLYASDRVLSVPSQVPAILFVWALAVLFVFAVCISLDASHAFCRGWGPSFAIAAPALILGHRLLLQRLLAAVLDRGWVQCRRILLITDTPALSYPAPFERWHKVSRTHLLPRDPDRVPDFFEAITGSLAHDKCVDEVHIAIGWSNWLKTKRVLSELREVPIPVRLIADPNATEILQYPQQKLCGRVSFELQRAPLTAAGARVAKRLLDIVGAGLGLLLLSPLFVAISFVIWIDSRGPVFFRQKRGGFNGRVFHILKFRTMRVLEDGPCISQATRDDDRVTRVGRFLRHSSLDELPQLINVLCGAMSLVGPRPHALAHDDAYRSLISGYPFRQYVKPGMTGWAQVNGFRGETPTVACMKRRVDLDLWYACNWSFWLDVRILFSTCREVCRSRNAF
jgi:putative colanic acid biosynthesis UDP-glucose lipid carrier transferase